MSVSRINLATNTVDATIVVGGGPYEVAMNSTGTFTYATNFDADTVSRIGLTIQVPILTLTKSAPAKAIAAYAMLPVTRGATFLLRVALASTKYRKVSGTNPKGLKAGSCGVMLIVAK